LEDVGSKFVPPNLAIGFCFGGLVLTAFLVQVATGFALTFYYRPAVSEALASVRSIMVDVHFRWFGFDFCCIVLHVCRFYLTGGFKKPREVTWITGVALAVCTVSFGVTGYSLPYDQVGYWALRIVSGVLEEGQVLAKPP
jgi:cytochrome b6